jgi:hypothetical protein
MSRKEIQAMNASRIFSIVFVCSLATAAAVAAQPLPLPLADGNFAEWQDGAPVRWKVDVGARSGGGGLSRLAPLDGGGVELAGDARTGQWQSLSQRVETGPGYVRLIFEAETSGLVQERGQFNNCYVGLAAFDAGDKRLAVQVRDLFEPEWAPGQLVVQLPAGTKAAQVIVFLSKTGSLRVRKVHLERLSPADSFDVLVEELDRYYSFFALKKINWSERAKTYGAAAGKANTPDDFVRAVKPLLTELADLHVSIQMPDGKSVPSYISAADRNFDARTIAGKLKDVKQIGRMGFIGRTEGGYGYVAIGTLAADKQTTDDMLAAFDTLLDAKGLIIDLRPNGGGSERVAQQFVSRLIGEPLVYASNQFRSGPATGDLVTLGTRTVGPQSDKPFRGPVIGLIGPGCVSSGEGFALMLKARPRSKLIGLPTRGASGNPQPVQLPNGLVVHYSTWVPLGLDGQPFEGKGIQPDIRVDDDPTGEKGLAKAIEQLDSGLK